MTVATGRFQKWPLSADLASLSGSNNWTGVGSPAFSGGALQLVRASTQYCTNADAAAWQKTDFTVFARVISTDVPTQARGLIGQYGNSANRAWYFGASASGGWTMTVRDAADAGTTLNFFAANPVVAGAETQVFMGVDVANLKIWMEINGLYRETTLSGGFSLQNPTQAVELGRATNANTFCWNGSVRDLEIWDRTLTRAERRARANDRETVAAPLSLLGVTA